MSRSGFTRPQCQVICVCGGYGFPLGNASAARITIVGKALQEAGIRFHLLHCGPSRLTINTQRSGVYQGITFEYTTAVTRPENTIARLLVYIWAILVLTARLIRLWPARRETLVYLYLMDGPINLYTGCLCYVLGLPVVQELCEWIPNKPTCSMFTHWLHRKPMFKLATGVLVISEAIEERVRQRCVKANPQLLVYRLPAIVDAQRFAAADPMTDRSEHVIPNFVYCGTWVCDILFIIRALSLVKRGGYPCKLRIVGSSVEQSGPILDHAIERGLSPDDILFMGCVDDRTLEACYKGATALLLPLPDDDESKTRFPNKLSEYLASGRPVVTCNIGDLTTFLIDNRSAYLAEPGNERDFADKMITVLRDPTRAKEIGAAGQRVCFAHLDYRACAAELTAFFLGCIESYRDRCSARRQAAQVHRGYMLLRNSFCGLLALGLIASNRVRRARKRALSGDLVTAIYFHRPNRRLFARCIQWLIKYGYTFVSADDLMDMLYRGEKLPRGAVWLSFDDGFKELLEDVLPLICQHKISVTLFIPAGIVEGDGLLPWLHPKTSTGPYNSRALPHNALRDALTVAEVTQVASYPEVTIGSHTVSHAVTIHLTEENARFELRESKRALESWTRADVTSFAYPEGRCDGRERLLLTECGYRLAATTENAFITSKTDPYLLPRFNVADEISFPEAICNMVGVWRPVIDSLILLVRRWQNTIRPLLDRSGWLQELTTLLDRQRKLWLSQPAIGCAQRDRKRRKAGVKRQTDVGPLKQECLARWTQGNDHECASLRKGSLLKQNHAPDAGAIWERSTFDFHTLASIGALPRHRGFRFVPHP